MTTVTVAEEVITLTEEVVETITVTVAEQGPPGVGADHSGLLNLDADGHLQYHTDARGDARYAALAHDHSGVYEPADADIQSHLANTSNPHSVTAAQAGADATGTAAGLIATHEAAVNPHPGYLTPVEGDAAYAAIGHNHTGTYDPAGTATSAVSSHAGGAGVHTIAGVTGLQTALDGKSATSHDHAATYAPIAKGVTNGDSHDHSGGDGAQIAYSGLSGLPTLGSAAATASTDYATAAQGSTADSALQPGDDAADLGSGAAMDNYVLTADGAGGAAWEAAAVTYAGAASEIHAATDKATPVDADELGLVDSSASWVLKKLTWANIKATITSYLNLKTATGSIGGSDNLAIGTSAMGGAVTGNGNLAIGSSSLSSLTTGGNNLGFGKNTLNLNVSGNYNVAIGIAALEKTTNSNNTAIGTFVLRNCTTGNGNVGIGYYSQNSVTTGSNNIGIGISAQQGITTGSNNIGIGNNSGRYHADGSTALTDPENSVYIGYSARGKDNSDNNSVVIGGNTPIGLGANTTVIGTSATTLTRLFGNIATGVDSPSAAIHAIKTTEQLRLGYDASYYAAFTVSSAGNLTINAVGGTIYTPDDIECTTSGGGVILKSPDGTRYRITVANGGTISVSAA